MHITFLGQAGLFIETKHGTILCDPWFNPAYFASWFPFPSNEGVDIEKLKRPDYLYLSHQHHDHFDPQFLRDHVWKEATILLPDYPLKSSRARSTGYRFHKIHLYKKLPDSRDQWLALHHCSNGRPHRWAARRLKPDCQRWRDVHL